MVSRIVTKAMIMFGKLARTVGYRLLGQKVEHHDDGSYTVRSPDGGFVTQNNGRVTCVWVPPTDLYQGPAEESVEYGKESVKRVIESNK